MMKEKIVSDVINLTQKAKSRFPFVELEIIAKMINTAVSVRIVPPTVIATELCFDKPYLLAMANAGPGTNGSQFFVTVAATAWLNRKHTIFGEVADQESRDVVDKIAATPTGAMDKPSKDVVINNIEI